MALGRIDMYDHRVRMAVDLIATQYGHKVSVDNKRRGVLKFGRSELGKTTRSTVWTQGGEEVFASTNAIDTISSSDASDTEPVKITGHTISGGLFTYVEQDATLTGQSKVVLGTPLARVERLYNDGTADFVGDIYCYEDTAAPGGVPSDSDKIHLKVSNANQSFKLSMTVPDNEYLLITGMVGSVLEKSGAYAEFTLSVREAGKIFRERFTMAAAADGGSKYIPFDPLFIIRPNSDLRVDCVASAINTAVSGNLFGYVAVII